MGGFVCEGVSNVVSQDIIQRLLDPYFPSCRYLKGAVLDSDDRLGIRGEFSIPSSCYVEGTGHFNAVEFVMCFNQLTYVLFGAAVDRGLAPELKVKTLDEFVDVQLTNSYITRSKMSFRKVIDPKEFNGSIYVNKKRVIRNNNFYSVDVNFSDSNGGKAWGSFDLVMT